MRLCRQCGRPLTAQQARQALARMIEAGVPLQEARSKSPRCYFCVGLLLRAGLRENPAENAGKSRTTKAERTEKPETRHETRLSDTHR